MEPTAGLHKPDTIVLPVEQATEPPGAVLDRAARPDLVLDRRRPTTGPSFDVAIVTYNSKDDLKRGLPSLEEITARCESRLIVVDNASSDGSANYVLAREAINTEVIELPRNRGYAAAVNIAAQRSRADYLVLLNPDILVPSGDAIERLIEHLEQHPEAAVAAPRLLDPDGRLQDSARPTPSLAMLLARQTALGRTRAGRRLTRRYLQAPRCEPGGHATPEWTLGAAMAIRRSDLDRVGGWDERFFLYFEDVEFCYRLRALGREVHYLPGVEMIHDHHRESRKEQGSMLSSTARREHVRSALKFFCKYPHLLIGGGSEARLRTPIGSALQRGLDIAVSGLALLALLPVMLVIAACIRLDSPGPALFRQRRIGRGGRPFTTIKFRSMEQGADSSVAHDRVRRHVHGTPVWSDEHGRPVFKYLPRDGELTTRVGRILRRWSLDELPQLINVLRGEMTLVGYRPPTAYEIDHYPEWYFGRFAVKPGLTGIWQVSGRNGKSYVDMVRCDVQYVKTRNWRLDLTLLLRTLPAVLTRRGAF